MTPFEIYDSFLVKSEENGLNDNISISPERFVINFNEQLIRFVEYTYEKNNDDIRYIQSVLVDDKKLKESSKHLDHEDFVLPKDYMLISNVYGKASSGKCKNKKIDLYPIKDKDRNLILQNYEVKPSFRHRESVYDIASNNLKVYVDNFTLESVYLSYYRYPTSLRLINDEQPELGLDNSIRLDFDKKVINRIVSLTVASFDMNNSNQRFQINQQQAISKI